jgi:hypothetical protein
MQNVIIFGFEATRIAAKHRASALQLPNPASTVNMGGGGAIGNGM